MFGQKVEMPTHVPVGAPAGKYQPESKVMKHKNYSEAFSHENPGLIQAYDSMKENNQNKVVHIGPKRDEKVSSQTAFEMEALQRRQNLDDLVKRKQQIDS